MQLLRSVWQSAVVAAIAVSAAAPAAAAPAAGAAGPPASLSWRVAQTRCVDGAVHLDVAITGAVVGARYAIYATSGLRASNEEVVARADAFTASFTPNEAYGSNDAAHFSVTGDVEAPAIGQRSPVRTVSAACAARSGPPATVPTTLSTSLGFDANALNPPVRHTASRTGRTVAIVIVGLALIAAAALLTWLRRRRPQRS
ncbi:MAG TPA: hypothetical protein VGN35_09750 [Jatrophihabitantaceae bacterium]|nr:hypothetical protein [Jatrophihabitantaceae bacterium]